MYTVHNIYTTLYTTPHHTTGGVTFRVGLGDNLSPGSGHSQAANPQPYKGGFPVLAGRWYDEKI